MQFSTVATTIILALTASSVTNAAPIPVNVQEIMLERRAAFDNEL